MKRILTIIFIGILASMLLFSCATQSSSNVPYYRYQPKKKKKPCHTCPAFSSVSFYNAHPVAFSEIINDSI